MKIHSSCMTILKYIYNTTVTVHNTSMCVCVDCFDGMGWIAIPALTCFDTENRVETMNLNSRVVLIYTCVLDRRSEYMDVGGIVEGVAYGPGEELGSLLKLGTSSPPRSMLLLGPDVLAGYMSRGLNTFGLSGV